MRHPLLLLPAAALLAACADDPVAPVANRSLNTETSEDLQSTPLAITGVSARSGKTYRVATNFAAGVLPYVDRSFTVKATVPAALARATYIRTANDDKNASPGSTDFLKFTVNQAATVYVMHDSRIPTPSWLTSQYVDTKLVVSTTDAPFRVFRREVPLGAVTLGSNSAKAVGGSMYFVAVAPRAGAAARPVVTVSAPQAGATVSGQVTLTAQVEGTGISGVQFRVDGKNVGSEDTSAPYGVTWNAGAVASGTHSITAVARHAAGRDSATIQVSVAGSVAAPAPGVRGGYYVSPTGSASGDGSASRPWDLATALAHPSKVVAGDTIWLRGGSYRGALTSRLTGTASRPIVVRQYPGERATSRSPAPRRRRSTAWR